MVMPPWTGPRHLKRLRCATKALLRGRPADPRREPDHALLKQVQDPYADVAEAEDRMRDLLDAFRERDDRRAVFLTVYVEMTGAVRAALEQDRFVDPAWMSDYLVSFADLYRQAVHAHETGDASRVPGAWRVAFEAAASGDLMVVQEAALGVNAHINRDLAFALDQVGLEPAPGRKFADHSTITEVIRGVTDRTQDLLVEQGAAEVAWTDRPLGTYDERLLVFSVDECRDNAWRTGRALGSNVPGRRAVAAWLTETAATGIAYFIRSWSHADLRR